ncbi:MAG: hypothetical protein JRG73_18075 [Deltaproteobacteria bacterium]|nr:hypothetical protein [Deltaproteobacteria bacterium]MBW2308834.1 hypothetical protein [Deltaproteobacteria bacterium]
MTSNHLRILEIKEVLVMPGLGHFQLYEDTSRERESWDRYLWRGRSPTGHTVIAKYDSAHLFLPMRIFVEPDIDTCHKLADGSICYLKDFEWSPNWTAATAILTAFRFLDEYGKGLL